MISRINYITSN